MRPLTNLELMLLGILAQESLSGHSLRKRFATPSGISATALVPSIPRCSAFNAVAFFAS